MKNIVLTGGGTAGHVTPHIALLPSLREAGYTISYIGSKKGIERELIEKEGLPYYPISSGKLRRYFSLRNFTDPFRVLAGYFSSLRLLKKLKPDLVFSKGGFVSVPVVRAAGKLQIPVIIHESDMTPGLANRLSYGCATRICCNFPETLPYLPEAKACLTGSPIRQELLTGDKNAALMRCGFTEDKPVLLVIGGSSGAKAINDAVRASLDTLLADYQVLHLCGKGMLDPALSDTPGYHEQEYAGKELKDYFAAASLVISRAGANSICEFVALGLPNLLIPLPASQSRGDQILNAKSFRKQGFSAVLPEEELNEKTLPTAVSDLYANRQRYIDAMQKAPASDSIAIFMNLFEECRKKTS